MVVGPGGASFRQRQPSVPGQSGNVTALELDIHGGGSEPGATESSTKKETRTSTEDRF